MLQIVLRNLKIPAESRVIAGILGSWLEFVPEILADSTFVHNIPPCYTAADDYLH